MNEKELKDMALKFQSALLESSYQFNQKLEKQNTQLKDNWNKLKEYISNNNRYFEKADLEMVSNALNGLDVLEKMQEIEGGMND